MKSTTKLHGFDKQSCADTIFATAIAVDDRGRIMARAECGVPIATIYKLGRESEKLRRWEQQLQQIVDEIALEAP
jgi:hypothetical protein